MDERKPWQIRLEERNAQIAAANAEAERRDASAKSRAKLLRALFWLGLMPFFLIALLIMHESAWFDGYQTGWTQGTAGKPFGELP